MEDEDEDDDEEDRNESNSSEPRLCRADPLLPPRRPSFMIAVCT